MFRKIKILWYKIVMSYRWAKFGWNDSDWDYAHIFEALIFKLNMHQKCMKNFNNLNGSEDYSEQISKAAKLIEDGINEINFVKASKMIDDKYGELSLDILSDKINGLKISLVRDKRTEENKEEYLEDLRNFYADAEKADDELIRRGFNIIIDNYRKWWF